MSGKTIGVEALVRWQHPERGLVAPDQFIPIAENTGLIANSANGSMRQACLDAAGWPEHIKIAVNLSPAQFKRNDLVDFDHRCDEDVGSWSGRLELEITETVLLQDDEENLALSASIALTWHFDRARRFRHRLFVAELSAALPVRQDQDRPVVRRQSHHPAGLCGDRLRGDRVLREASTSRPQRKASRRKSNSGCCARPVARRRRAFCSAVPVPKIELISAMTANGRYQGRVALNYRAVRHPAAPPSLRDRFRCGIAAQDIRVMARHDTLRRAGEFLERLDSLQALRQHCRRPETRGCLSICA